MIRHLLLGAVLLTAACSGKTAAGGDCSGNGSCRPGEVCSAGICLRLCSADGDCAANQICGADTCIAGTRRELPTISGIDATGRADTQPGHAAHRTSGHLLVQGTFLEGASVELSGPGVALDLDVCGRAPNQL